MTDFKELEPYIIGSMLNHPSVEKFVIYSNHAPILGEKIKYKDDIWEIVYCEDDTTDEEFEQGLSYNLIRMEKV